MPSIAVMLLIALGCPALLLSIALTVYRFERRRDTRGRFRWGLLGKNRNEPTALFVPCKGSELGLEENLRRLFEQDHSSYRMCFIVEDAADTALPIIRRLQREYAIVPSQIVISGRAVDCGQKVHNLRVATERLDEKTSILAFVDSDARPHGSWLETLVDRLDSPGVGAVTGYRWFIPERQTWPNIMLAAINNSVATFYGRGSENCVWGGAWTIRREVFEATAIRDAWYGTLSDDLVATRALFDARLRIDYEPRCMTESPIDVTWSHASEFLRRQYMVGRSYVPIRWTVALVANTILQLAFWGNTIAAIACFLLGSVQGWWHVAVAGSLYALWVLRTMISQTVFAERFAAYDDQLRNVRRVERWLAPLVGLFNLMGMVSSIVGYTIAWRGIRYWMSPGGRILLMGRRVKLETSRTAATDTSNDQASEVKEDRRDAA